MVKEKSLKKGEKSAEAKQAPAVKKAKKTEAKETERASTAKKAEPEKEKKKSKAGLVIGIIAGVAVLAVGGFFGVKTYFAKTTETVESVEISEDTRSFSGFFKEYLADRVAADNLFGYQFRELTSAETLDKLTELKDGFSKVSRGMNGFEEGEFKELAAVMKSDATEYLALVRTLRAVETGEYASEADRQVAFIKAVDEGQENLRSKLYISRSAFVDDPGGLGNRSILIFKGTALAEVGGGVMNIFVGNIENNIVALTGEDFESGAVKAIAAEKLYGFVNTRVVKFGMGVKNELEKDKLTAVNIELGTSDAKVTRKKVGLFGKTVWKLEEVTEEYGAEALVLRESRGMSQILTETEVAIRGKKKAGEA